MRALCIGHDHRAGFGLVGERLEHHGIALEPMTVVPAARFTTPWVDADFPEIDAYDMVVTVGAPWPAVQIERWAAREVELLAAAHELGRPVLGICFGAQLLARALGGSTTRASEPEVGWTHVESHDESRVPSGMWFQWHEDAFLAPAGSVELARNAVGVQAFASGTSMGVQFHPEMTLELLRRWLGEGEAATAARDRRLVDETARHASSAQGRAGVLVDGWLAAAGVTAR